MYIYTTVIPKDYVYNNNLFSNVNVKGRIGTSGINIVLKRKNELSEFLFSAHLTEHCFVSLTVSLRYNLNPQTDRFYLVSLRVYRVFKKIVRTSGYDYLHNYQETFPVKFLSKFLKFL